MYSCPPMPPVSCPPPCPPPKPKDDACSKYYREIGTAMIGNHLIIRMERDKGKSKKGSKWDPPCDCEVVEIQRPTSKQGPKILKGADNNQILFRVQSKSHVLGKKDSDNLPQAISYEVARCKGGPNTNDQCRTFTIYPILNGSGTQEVHTDRVTEGDENVFMLKVKKKPQSTEEPKGNIELELRTPKPPPLPPVLPPAEVTQKSPSYEMKSPCRKEKKPCNEEEKPPEDTMKKETAQKKKKKKHK
ncbi:uncharacterized protein LOC143183299 [Calliopsis andreniformis]|uniref:uncharacterized protein LOC143183299 n=1 Tax=Calliopsis andreniformis TaxID=337506 RepID=UPI003FCEB227